MSKTRKIIGVAVAGLLAFGFSACAGEEKVTEQPTPVASETPTVEEPAPEPTLTGTYDEGYDTGYADGYAGVDRLGELDGKTHQYITGYAEGQLDGQDQLAEDQKPDFTVEQELAVKRAASYLESSAFSRTGLLEQLAYEEVKPDVAEWAVSKIESGTLMLGDQQLTVDWNAEAAEAAHSYVDNGIVASRGDLESQLEYEGFTAEQIAFALTAVGL